MKVAEQVLVVSQLLVTLKVTVLEPPQAGGAPVLLLVMEPPHPPVKEAVANQLLYFVLIVA